MQPRKNMHGYTTLFMGIIKALAVVGACVFIVLLAWRWVYIITRIIFYYE